MSKKHTKNLYTSGSYNANFASHNEPENLADVEFWGDSREVLRGFPDAVKQDLGYAIWQLQLGQVPADRKPMPGIGPGVFELREQDERGWYRVIHLKKTKNVIHILHCFEKDTNKTEQKDIETARARLAKVLAKQQEEARNAKREGISKNKRQRS